MSQLAGLRVISFVLMVPVLLCGSELRAQTDPRRAAGPSGSCDLQALERSEAEFLRLARLRRFEAGTITDEDVRRASAEYVVKADQCYEALYAGATPTTIDPDGVWFGTGVQAFVTGGTKWGAGSPYTGGTNVSGPRLPGGTVTFSFMATGVSMAAEGSDASLTVSSLPTYSSCFVTDIRNAFLAWSLVADIQFLEVADNGIAFNAPGASADIRIAAHTFDGQSGILAHAYFPPPNGNTAAGDVHFDRSENWSCSPGSGIDIGIVSIHEVGHSIGLHHELTNSAIMRPTYNPTVGVPLADDINGASSIYGNPAPPPSTTVGDFDGDHRTDVAVWRPSTGTWYEIRSSNLAFVGVQWGAGYAPYNDLPAPGDYDGDGRIDVAVWRSSTAAFYVILSSTNMTTVRQLGSSTDQPVPGDYDGDGRTDFAVWHPSSGTWDIVRSSDGTTISRQPGTTHAPNDDIPVAADYDRDGKTDIAVWRASTGTWYATRSSDAVVVTKQWGAGYAPYNDVPVPGDYDGDGKADFAVWRRASGYWHVFRSSDSVAVSAQWGASNAPYNDLPVPGDYDGDARTDVAVWRASTGMWYVILSSSGGVGSRQWGASTDIPIPQP